ncbi:amidohydrolase family protein [Flavobacterium tructae]|uniref:amidohydrolase family protein n=1 Tax=Flavobacterium tructae TaxID=1114873 RepID=UPI001F345EDF|nr:amidohydrolase family protein [Flavobacterium tructae]
MQKKLVLIFLFSAFNLIIGYSQKEVNIKVTILKNGFVFDDKFDLKTGSIIIKGNQIADILYTDNFSEYPGATIIDITGKYVMPGLIDAHVHLATAPNLTREKSTKYMEDQLSKMIYAGITTVRDMTGNAIILADYKQVSTLNQLPAPSIFYAAQFAGPDYFNSMRKYTTEKDTPWQRTITDTTNIKMVVAEAKGAGVTGIKIYNDLSARMIRKIVKKAKKTGITELEPCSSIPCHTNRCCCCQSKFDVACL